LKSNGNQTQSAPDFTLFHRTFHLDFKPISLDFTPIPPSSSAGSGFTAASAAHRAKSCDFSWLD
jgi:hypothetical protein